MTVQKFVKYTPLDITGQVLNSTYELKLNVLENSGNYLIHKDILRHYSSQKQGTVSTKTRSEVRAPRTRPGGQTDRTTKSNRRQPSQSIPPRGQDQKHQTSLPRINPLRKLEGPKRTPPVGDICPVRWRNITDKKRQRVVRRTVLRGFLLASGNDISVYHG